MRLLVCRPWCFVCQLAARPGRRNTRQALHTLRLKGQPICRNEETIKKCPTLQTWPRFTKTLHGSAWLYAERWAANHGAGELCLPRHRIPSENNAGSPWRDTWRDGTCVLVLDVKRDSLPPWIFDVGIRNWVQAFTTYLSSCVFSF